MFEWVSLNERYLAKKKGAFFEMHGEMQALFGPAKRSYLEPLKFTELLNQQCILI